MIALLAGLFVMVSGASENENEACAGVVLVPAEEKAATTAELREVYEVLVERAAAMQRAKPDADSLFISLDRDRLILDAPGRTCEEAAELATSSVARTTTIEIVFPNALPQFQSDDFEPRVEFVDDEVRLRLRAGAREEFQRLTRLNVGKAVAVHIDDAPPIELPVRSEQMSGVIVLDRQKVPSEAFLGETILPLRLRVEGCGRCIGEYH